MSHQASPARTPPVTPVAPVTTRLFSPPLPLTSLRAAQRVLRHNWTGSSVPSRSPYPHQWSWDSAFITSVCAIRRPPWPAVSWRRSVPHSGATGDGRIPHIVFPAGQEMSGFVQPPVHALAALLVHRADPVGTVRGGFLSGLYPRLTAWQRCLTTTRDAGGGLAAPVRPWESGMDNSPCCDAPLARVTPAPPDSYRRADLSHSATEDRPTDEDYGRYVTLAADYRDHGYTDEQPRSFAVEEPGFNALLARWLRPGGDRGGTGAGSRRGPAPRGCRGPHRSPAAPPVAPAAGLFLCRDLRGGAAPDSASGTGVIGTGRVGADGELLPQRGAAGLLLPGLPAGIRAALLRSLTGEHFGLGAAEYLDPRTGGIRRAGVQLDRRPPARSAHPVPDDPTGAADRPRPTPCHVSG